jgi:hypothetical protein
MSSLISKVLWRLIFISFYVIIVLILKHIDVLGADYDRAGFLIISYWVLRLALAIYIMMLCIGAGSLLLQLFYSDFPSKQIDTEEYLILGFFFGSSTYGIIFILIGFAGLLNLPVALLITIPVLWISYPSICEIQRMLIPEIKFGTKFKIFQIVIFGCLIGVIGLLVFSKGLYPGTIDNDVWEHYLHYYREVLQNGSIWPNEIWGHFYISKGAGLFFLGNLLSDPFAAQLVSLGFIIMAGFIVFNILRKYSGDILWAVLGVIIFFAIYDGNFFKHHSVLTGYIAFQIWAAIQIVQQDRTRLNIVLVVASLSIFYLTFYIPIIALLLGVFWGSLAAISFLTHLIPHRTRYFIIIAIFTGLGVSTALLVNYRLTGLAEMVPLNFFWQFAEHEKFESIFGSSGILFFLNEQSGLHMSILSNLKNMPLWICEVFRLFSLKIITLFSIAYLIFPITSILLRKNSIDHSNRLASYISLFVVLGSLILSAIAVGFFAQVASTYRLFAFTAVATSIILIIILKLLMDASSNLKLPEWYKMCFFSSLSILALVQAGHTAIARRQPAIIKFAYGGMSFRDVLSETDGYFNRNVKFETIEKFRNRIGKDARIMALGYDPAPGYFSPGRGVVSEPSYTMGKHYLSLVFEKPAKSKALLQSTKINYFFLNLRSQLFTGLTFSSLFKADSLNNNFELVSQNGESYLLTWRTSGNTSRLPQKLVRILDLKQTGILFYPFSNEFNASIHRLVRKKIGLIDTNVKRSFLTENAGWIKSILPAQIKEIFQNEIEKRGSLPDNRTLFNNVVDRITGNLQIALPDLISNAWTETEAMEVGNDSFNEVLSSSISSSITTRIKTLFIEGYSIKFDKPLLKALTVTDERALFGSYQNWSKVQSLLGNPQ